MKQLFILLLAYTLSGCAYFRFDAHEYDQVIILKLVTEEYIEKCGSLTDNDVEIIKTLTTRLKTYSKYRVGQDDIFYTTSILDDMAVGLNEKMSKTYCEIKLKNISTGATKLAETLGGLL